MLTNIMAIINAENFYSNCSNVKNFDCFDNHWQCIDSLKFVQTY